MMKARYFFFVLPFLISGCGDPEVTRATPEFEREPVERSRPNPLQPPDETTDARPSTPQPLEPAIGRAPESDISYVGLWAHDPGWCDNPSGAQRPIEITATSFSGYEQQCAFQSIEQDGADRWDAVLECAAEGQENERRITMAVNENTLYITYHDIADQGVSYRRCAEPDGSGLETPTR